MTDSDETRKNESEHMQGMFNYRVKKYELIFRKVLTSVW